jgi:hypothetical protein
MNLLNVLRTLKSLGENELVSQILLVLSRTAFTAQEHATLCMLFYFENNFVKCIEHGEKAIENEELRADENIKFYLFGSYKQENEFDKAIQIIESVNIKEAQVSLAFEKATCLYDSNKKDEAYKLLKSIDQDGLNELEKLKYNAVISNHLLRNGQFKDGLRHVIVTRDELQRIENGRNYHNRAELPLEFWEGTPDCKNLIVYLEAGLGDEIINVRFLNNLKKMGINVKIYNVFYEDPEKNNRKGFIELYQKNGFEMIQNFSPEKYADYKWTYSQYLPILLNLGESELWKGPYLKAGKKKLSKKKNIGLRWSGNEYPKFRNFKLKEVYDTLSHLDCTFYSVQKDLCLEEIQDCPDVIDLSSKLNSVEDLAAYINSFDLLITCPTITCTLAGALDKKCIVLNPCSDYYIFNTKNNQTPWFGKNMQLLRQKTPKIWSDCLDDLNILTEKMLKD